MAETRLSVSVYCRQCHRVWVKKCWKALQILQSYVTVSSRPEEPYLTLPSGWADCYTCPALRPYQFGPMRNPDVTRRSQ